jgi:hypothetical protein
MLERYTLHEAVQCSLNNLWQFLLRLEPAAVYEAREHADGSQRCQWGLTS